MNKSIKGTKKATTLEELANVGKATRKDLALLSIHTVEQLAQCDPDDLYKRLCTITQTRHDPCVWDVFAAIIHEAQTGIPSPWWAWTKIRKSESHLK